MKKIASFMSAMLFLASSADAFDALSFERKIDDLVQKEHEGAYYFEKLGFDGTWIPTILVFGYPNNVGACDSILKAASLENPTLSFRCRAAN
ncbi:hypothetical protein [Paracoccus versutus]